MTESFHCYADNTQLFPWGLTKFFHQNNGTHSRYKKLDKCNFLTHTKLLTDVLWNCCSQLAIWTCYFIVICHLKATLPTPVKPSFSIFRCCHYQMQKSCIVILVVDGTVSVSIMQSWFRNGFGPILGLWPFPQTNPVCLNASLCYCKEPGKV